MKNPIKKATGAAVVIAIAVLTSASSCSYDETTAETRANLQESVTIDNSLEQANLKEKLLRENDPNAVRYVYLMNFGQIVGFYVIKGKVSSSGSQLAPEQEPVSMCSYSECWTMADSAQDDGTFGVGDPGIFFFTADGAMISTSLDYLESDTIIPIDVPRLGG